MAPSSNTGLAFGWGLRIASAIAIPGTVPCPAGEGAPDVTVALGDRCRIEPWPDLYQWDGTTLDFAPPGVALYRITRHAIEILPCPGANRGEITALLVATALPALLWMRGRFVLHAAGVILPQHESALAIAGISGAGKSTLARAFVGGEARLVGDDTLAIELASDAAQCRGLGGGLFVNTPSRRRFTAVPGELSGAGKAEPLKAICVLAPGEVGAIRPLAGAAAFEALMQNRHRPRVPMVLGRQQAVMDAAAAICRTTPVFEVRFDKARQAPQELAAEISNFLSKD